MRYDLYPIIMNELKCLYGLTSENESCIYEYLYIRTAISHDKRKVRDREIFNFLIKELNLPIHEDSDKLSDSKFLEFKRDRYYLIEESSKFIDNLKFRAEMSGDILLKDKTELVFRKGYQMSRKYRNVGNYKQHEMYNRLSVLNSEFGAHPAHPRDIEGFELTLNHNSMKRSLEGELEVLLAASKRETVKDTVYITEKVLERYLIENIEKIEKGMVFLDSQVKIPNGIIDILARDESGKICIIELKVAQDKEIIWQALYYPMEIKKKYNSEVRMITVAPEYNDSIYKGLKSIENVEPMSYEIEAKDDEIVNLKVFKFISNN